MDSRAHIIPIPNYLSNKSFLGAQQKKGTSPGDLQKSEHNIHETQLLVLTVLIN